MTEEDGFLRNLKRLVEPGALSEVIRNPGDSIIAAAEEAGIVFRLDIKRFATDSIFFGHQIMLVVAAVIPPAGTAAVDIHHLVDLGVIHLREGQPNSNVATVERAESGLQLWTTLAEVEKVWDKLQAELSRYTEIWINPPAVISRRPLLIAVVGLDYFNHFAIPRRTNALPHVFVSSAPLPRLF